MHQALPISGQVEVAVERDPVMQWIDGARDVGVPPPSSVDRHVSFEAGHVGTVAFFIPVVAALLEAGGNAIVRILGWIIGFDPARVAG